MFLPSGFAGATVKLIPSDRLRNPMDDLLISSDDPRETLFCYRLLTVSASPKEVSEVIMSTLLNYPYIKFAYHKQYYNPVNTIDIEHIRTAQRERMIAIKAVAKANAEYLIGP